MSEQAPVLSEGDRVAYDYMAKAAGLVTQKLGKAWRRTVHHDQEIERAALWNVLGLDQACSEILEAGDQSRLLRPNIGKTAMRYDVEAGIHMIPELLPYTTEERHWLRSNPAYQACNFGHGIYDERHLVWDWHLWIWQRQSTGSGRFASMPSPDGQLLAEACTRLADGLAHVLSTDPPHTT